MEFTASDKMLVGKTCTPVKEGRKKAGRKEALKVVGVRGVGCRV